MPSDLASELHALLAASLPELRIPPRQIAVLLPLCRARRLARGAVLYPQGAPTPALFGTVQGEIEVRFCAVDGAVSVIEHIPPGRLFGLSSFASGLPSTFEALATRPTRVLAFGPAAYAYLMDEVSGFARALMREFAQRHHGALRLLEAARHRSPMERLSMALEQLAHSGRGEVASAAPSATAGLPVAPMDAPGFRFIRVTQAELAALAHLSRQTVNALLAELARSGRLRPAYRGVWLAPPE